MILAEVISRVVATQKSAALPARALLSVRPLRGFGDPYLELIAIDSVQAGPGDTVLIVQEGTGARQTTLEDSSKPLPAQVAIVGIVDQIDWGS